MTENDNPEVTDEEQLAVVKSRGGSLIERWLHAKGDVDPLERVDTLVEMLQRLRLASIKATYPSDWLIHSAKDREGNLIRQVGYLQDVGAERAGKVWGIEVGAPAIEREDFPDGSYTYHMISEAWSKVTGERVDYCEGSRWSGDKFFQHKTGEKDADGKDIFERVDPTDVRKSAYANLHGRAVRALSGLNGVPVDMLRQAGLDVNKVVHIDYGTGAKGGKSTGASQGGDDVISWGNAKGTKIADLTDKDLAYYFTAYQKDVADPAREKFRARNEKMLGALKDERDRREKASAQESAGGTPDLGKLRSEQFKRLTVASKEAGISAPRALHLLTEAWGTRRDTIGDMTADELQKLAGMDDASLTAAIQLASERE